MIKLFVTCDLLFILGMIGKIFAATALAEQDLEGIFDHNNDIDDNKDLHHGSSHWSYDNQHDWGGMCNKGKLQSPIELDYDDAEEKYFPPFNFSKESTPYTMDIAFNGHTIKVVFKSEGEGPSFNGGGYSDTYILDHLHFHWNSEHTINTYRHPAEAHLVHYKREYGNFSSALNHNDGIAVFAVLFDLSPEDDTILAMMMDDIKLTGHQNVPMVTTEYKLTYKDFIPRDTAGFFRYHGSLTTPDCDEVVIWTVFTNTIPISMEQLEVFKKCRKFVYEPLERNYRDTQDVNNRPIYLKTSPLIYSNARSVKATTFNTIVGFLLYIFMGVYLKLCQNSIL